MAIASITSTSADPDYPEERSPLADPQLGISVGDVITMVNGIDVLTAGHPNALLRNQDKQQVLLRLKPKGTGKPRDVVVYADRPTSRVCATPTGS